jgi:hypothetical protein
MLILILCLLYTVCAQPSAFPKYSRNYLRGLKRLENERIQAEYINQGIMYIEQGVFTAAKQGLVKYTIGPFPDCAFYSSPSDNLPNGVDKEVCDNILNGIRVLVSERFPDSEILYDATTKQYTLKWD